MDKELISRRFAKTLHQYNTMAVVQHSIADKLAKLLSEAIENEGTKPGNGLEIGSGTGFLTNNLVKIFKDTEWVINDITSQSQEFMPSDVRFIAADGESLELEAESLDIVATSSTIQWFTDIKGFMGRVFTALKQGGVVAISTFGPENFREITATTGDTLQYLRLNKLEESLNTIGFDILVCQEWEQQMVFESPIDVLHHIKSTGVNGIRQKRWTHRNLIEFEEEYRKLYSPITLTFNPQIVIAIKRRSNHKE